MPPIGTSRSERPTPPTGTSRSERPTPPTGSRAGPARRQPAPSRAAASALRNARRKTRARKRNARIFLCVGIAAVVLSVLFAVTVFFTVDVIEVRGNTMYTSDEIISQTGIQFGDNLLLMDKYRAINRAKDNLVFLDSMEIRRVLPNKLVIRVSEVVMAVAFDCGDGNYWLADRDGRLLQKVMDVPAYSAKVTGLALKNPRPGSLFVAAESEKQQPMETLLAAMKENDSYQSVSDIRIEKIYDIRLTYKERYEVIFGRSDQRNRLLRRVDPCGFVNAAHPAKKLRADCKKSRPLYCNFAQNSVQYTVYIRNEQNLDYKTREETENAFEKRLQRRYSCQY